MTAITKSVNGVVCIISPAVFGSGPNGQPVDFIGEDNGGVSPVITIQFDVPIDQFSLTVVGVGRQSHITRAFNGNGVLIQENVTTSPFATVSALSRPIQQGNASGVNRIFFPTFKEPVSSIQLIPPSNEFVGYRDLDVSKSFVVTKPKTTTEVLPSEIILPETKTIDLRDVIKINKLGLARQYVKGSFKALPTEVIVVENFSTEVEAQISLSGLAGVMFEPNKFTLAPKERKEVIIHFDIIELEKLPPGVSIINAAVNFTSTGLILPPIIPKIKPPKITIPEVVPVIIEPPILIMPPPEPRTRPLEVEPEPAPTPPTILPREDPIPRTFLRTQRETMDDPLAEPRDEPILEI